MIDQINISLRELLPATCIKLEKPLIEDEITRQISAQQKVTTGSSRVLVVEDEPNIAALVADIVQEHGYKTTIMLDGLKGYEIALKEDFALIITDVMLPYLSGYELCRKLKEAPNGKNVRIVLMSAAEQLVGKIEASLADDFLVKPFNITDIDRLVERYLKPVS